LFDLCSLVFLPAPRLQLCFVLFSPLYYIDVVFGLSLCQVNPLRELAFLTKVATSPPWWREIRLSFSSSLLLTGLKRHQALLGSCFLCGTPFPELLALRMDNKPDRSALLHNTRFSSFNFGPMEPFSSLFLPSSTVSLKDFSPPSTEGFSQRSLPR